MAYSIVFRGSYQYTDSDAAMRALAAAREDAVFEEGEPDADLGAIVQQSFDASFARSGASIRVAVAEHGPPGLYPIFETLIETLADTASSGLVTSEMEGVEVEYPAGSDED